MNSTSAIHRTGVTLSGLQTLQRGQLPSPGGPTTYSPHPTFRCHPLFSSPPHQLFISSLLCSSPNCPSRRQGQARRKSDFLDLQGAAESFPSHPNAITQTSHLSAKVSKQLPDPHNLGRWTSPTPKWAVTRTSNVLLVASRHRCQQSWLAR